MNEITQEQYKEALIALHDCTGTEEEANDAIIIIMAKWNVAFKPEPTSPDASSDKTITREKYESIVKKAVNYSAAELEEGVKVKVIQDIVDIILRETSVTVGPEPILPDCTEGNWEYESEDFGGQINSVRNGKRPLHIAVVQAQQGEEADANGAVLAGAKKLAELNVALFRKGRRISGAYQPEIRAVLAQLEKMGVDISEFEGEE